MIYEVENLEDARFFLSNSNSPVTITNPKGSTRYYGMRVIDYMFKTLNQEFPDIINDIVVNIYDDYSALITAKELGYKNIISIQLPVCRQKDIK